MTAKILDGKALALSMQAEIAARGADFTRRDGFGPRGLGLLTAGSPRFLPCTPLGVQQILVRNQIRIDGQHVVIMGRSNIVGKPLAMMLMQKADGANATLTVCHSKTRDIAAL